MADSTISGATVLSGSGLISTPIARAGSTAKYRRVDNLSATTDPTINDDSADGFHIGSRWLRSDTGETWICRDATAGAAKWQYEPIRDPRFGLYSYSDLMTALTSSGEWLYSVSGTGAGTSIVAVAANAGAGIVSLDLGTTNAGRSAVVPFNGSVGAALKLGQGVARFRSRFAVHTLSTGTETYTVRLGFIDAINGESTDGCFFRYTDGVNSGKWQAVCRSNGIETATAVDTGIAPVADAFQTFEVIVNAAGTSVDFKIDGAVVATTTSNIPTGSGRETGAGVFAFKSAGTTATSGGYVDYVELVHLFSTPR